MHHEQIMGQFAIKILQTEIVTINKFYQYIYCISLNLEEYVSTYAGPLKSQILKARTRAMLGITQQLHIHVLLIFS